MSRKAESGDRPSVVSASGHRLDKSPFLGRSYASFNASQLAQLAAALVAIQPRSILDPMAGQAAGLVEVVSGSSLGEPTYVRVEDRNGACMALARLRDPRIRGDWEKFRKRLTNAVRGLEGLGLDSSPLVASDELVSLQVRQALTVVMEGLEVEPRWHESQEVANDRRLRELACLQGTVCVAARNLVSFRGSANPTWLQPGGLWAISSIGAALIAAAAEIAEKLQPQTSDWGWLEADIRDATSRPQDSEGFDMVITSPPYANRLSYSQMWLPELTISQEVGVPFDGELGRQLLGTNSVAGWTRGLMDYRLDRLPESIVSVLDAIRSSSAYASDRYYYPFFLRYACGIQDSFEILAGRVNAGGTVIVVVNDTVRKGTVFPTAELIVETLQSRDCDLVERGPKLTTNHIGVRSAHRRSALVGPEQREHFLRFERRG